MERSKLIENLKYAERYMGMPEQGCKWAPNASTIAIEEAINSVEKLSRYEATGLSPEEIMDGRLLTGWIPVADRLPETSGVMLEDEKILIILADGTRTISFYINTVQGKKIFFDGWDTYSPIAWMPLPEPLDLQN